MIKKGDMVNFMGHKLKVKKISMSTSGRRVYMTCNPHCCKAPKHMVVECNEDSLKEITGNDKE